MHQIKLAARLSNQSIAPLDFAPFKFWERAMDADAENVASGQSLAPIITQRFFENNLIQNYAC